MERHDLLALMAELSLSGMRAAYDEVMAEGLKRQRTLPQILGELLTAERAEKKARSISYQLGAAKLPLARTLAEFDFAASPVNEGLVRSLHDGGFLETQRNEVFVGGYSSRRSPGKPRSFPLRRSRPRKAMPSEAPWPADFDVYHQ